MLRYDYLCTNQQCQLGFEIEQRVSEEPLKKCPACNQASLERVILSPPMIMDLAPKTVGSLCEKQTRELGKYGLEEKRRQFAEKDRLAREQARKDIEQKLPKGAKLAPLQEGRPWYGRAPDNIIKTTDPKRLTKYVMEGK